MPWASGEGRKAVMTEYFWQPIRGQPRRVDTNELRQFSQTFWVNACVKTIVDEVSGLDWDIVPKDEYEYDWVAEPIKTVKDFLNHPNKNGEKFIDLISQLVKDILEIDAGCIVKVFDINSFDFNDIEPKSGAPMLKPFGQRRMAELYVRDGASFLKEMDKFGFVKGYWQYSYQIPAHPMWFNKEEIVYCMEQPRSMSCYGYARTQAILDIIKSLHYSTLYNKKFFEETAIPDGALSLLDTNEVEMKAFQNYWNNEFKAQPHKVAIVNKDVKWQPFAVSQKELEFLETQKWYFNMVISEFGLTPSELGVTQDLNRSTSATQAEVVKRKGIRPLLKRIENYINEGILSEFGFDGIEFQFIYDDPAEKKARLDNWSSELSMGVKTVNEVRNEMGLEPIAGGDVSNTLLRTQAPPNGEKLPDAGEERESSGYKDQLRGQEQSNAQKITDETERKEKIRQPYSDNVRPTTVKSKKNDYKLMPYKDLIAEHEKLVDILEHGTDEQIKAEAEEQKKELEQYIAESNKEVVKEHKERVKGVDDGQYYRDQPISQPMRPSGAMFQPQNPKPKDTALPTPWSQLTQPHTDTQPSQVGSSQAKLSDTFDNKDTIHCPICGQATLASLNALEQLQDDLRCTNCGARFRTSELLESKLMEEMSNVLQQYNVSNPITIPEVKVKSFDKQYDGDMTVKDFIGFDMSKSFPYALDYASSKDYKRLLADYLSDLSSSKRDKIASIIKNAMRSGETISDVSRKIKSLVKDEERAELIARTEVIRVSNEGNVRHAEEKGTTKMEFLAAPEDGRLCEECAKHNGKVYKIKDVKGLLPLHPRCRCSLLEVYDPTD